MGVELGQYTYGNITLVGDGHVTVGKFCSIAGFVEAVFFPHHRVDWISTYPFMAPELLTYTEETWDGASGIGGHPAYRLDVVVGNDVWIGQGVKLLGGAKVGDGAVIGAFSVVAGEIAPYTIAVGSPARVIKKRFSDEQIESLLAIRWWDWERDKIEERIPLLCSVNVDEFIERELSGDDFGDNANARCDVSAGSLRESAEPDLRGLGVGSDSEWGASEC